MSRTEAFLLTLPLATLVTFLVAILSGYGDDWLMFRPDFKHTGYSASRASSTDNISLNFKTRGTVRSSEMQMSDRMYVDSDEKGYVESLDGHMYTLPEAQQRVHRVGNVYFCITNWGFWGSRIRDLYESQGGCFNPNPYKEVQAPSFETPPNSGLEYLSKGALWIGAIVESETEIETLVTVGADGWFWMYEMAPPTGAEGAIIERSTSPGVQCYSPDAISEQDIIAVFSDTADAPLTQQDITTDWDGRPHNPLGIEVTQRSYSWPLSDYDDFVILDYTIKNIGTDTLSQVYIALYVDPGVMHIQEDPYCPDQGSQDDLTGFLKYYVNAAGETTEVNIAWAGDNDGQPCDGAFTELSPTGVVGIMLLACSDPDAEISYNWWTSNSDGYPMDWGPWLVSNQGVWEGINPYGTGIYFPDSAMGTPGGDRSKYFVLSNSEMDYDQLYCALDHSAEGWISAPEEICEDLARGGDVRFLLSCGPFDLLPADSLFTVFAVMAGQGLHVNPDDFINYFDPDNPDSFYNKLDFSNLVKNAEMAREIYENGYSIPWYAPPMNFSGKSLSDSVALLTWSPKSDPAVKGFNIYRGTSPGQTGLTPINVEVITDTIYYDSGLSPKHVYYFSVASVNQDDSVGRRSDEIEILVGRPAIPHDLTAEASKGSVCLSWQKTFEGDVVRHKIFRSALGDIFYELIDSTDIDTMYNDNSVMNGVIYYYKVTAVDSMGMESFPSDSAYALPMAFDSGLGVIDRTHSWYCNKGDLSFRDSVQAFYMRIIPQVLDTSEISFSYLHRGPFDSTYALTLPDLSPFPMIIVHSEDAREVTDVVSESTATILEHYLKAGGKLIYEGANNSSFFFREFDECDTIDLCDGRFAWPFACEYLHIEEAFLPCWIASNRNEEFVGANSQAPGYPDCEIDTARIYLHWTPTPLIPPPDGSLPGIGFIVPSGQAEAIYTFESASDTSSLQGKPTAIRYLGDDCEVIFINFPLYFIREEEAKQILRQCFYDLEIPTSVEEDPNKENLVKGFYLRQNYPNPFNRETIIEYSLLKDCKVKITIYNILGQKVNTLVDEHQKSGYKKVGWDGRNERGYGVTSGIYFYTIQVGSCTKTKKMLLLK